MNDRVGDECHTWYAVRYFATTPATLWSVPDSTPATLWPVPDSSRSLPHLVHIETLLGVVAVVVLDRIHFFVIRGLYELLPIQTIHDGTLRDDL